MKEGYMARIKELEDECGRLREEMQRLVEAHARSRELLSDSLSVAIAQRNEAWKERDAALRELRQRVA